MTSKTCCLCLRQHIRNEPTNFTFLDLSLDDTLLQYLIRCPNLLDGHIQEKFEVLDVDENRHKTGSKAILCWIKSSLSSFVEAS